MKIKTELLQNMVAKAIKGSSNNNMIPLTSLIGIEAKFDVLTLITTDGSNQLRIKKKIELGNDILVSDEFYTIVNAETFSKLVAKTTKEYIELNNRENYLEVKGNGAYKLEIAINEEGEMVKFPEIPEIINVINKELSAENLKNILATAKNSVAKTMEIPFITGYYLGKNVITTDRQLICNIQTELFENPILISSEMAELLQLLEGQIVEVKQNENELIFETDNITVYGKELEGKEQYPVQQIDNCVNLQFKNSIKVNKAELLSVLDRMSLFVSDYDKGGVYLDFIDNKLVVTSQKSNASEEIEVQGNCDNYNCLIDIQMLKAEVQTIAGDIVEIWYGQDYSIKIVEGNTTIIISLLNKEN